MKRMIVVIIILTIAFIASSLLSQGTQGTKQTAPAKEKRMASLPGGFGSLSWGDKLEGAKDKVLGKIVYSDDKKKIISRDGEIEYKYGFFYVDAAIAEGEESDGGSTESSLFYVTIRFPYLARDDVMKRMKEKYGEPTGENISKNQGALLWDSENTTIIMWIDNYEDLPFCKKIVYLGKEISAKINEYQKQVFNKEELKVLKKLEF